MIKLVELLLTAELYNKNENLSEDDIPKNMRKVLYNNKGIKRPLIIKLDTAQEYCGDLKEAKKVPFIDYNTFNKQYTLTSFDVAAKWFVENAGEDEIEENPVLAYYFENYDSLGVSYEKSKQKNAPKHSDREWLRNALVEMEKNEDTAQMLGLVRVFSPEDIRANFNEIALDSNQIDEIKKINIALNEREFLRKIGMIDIGKLLFIGPPGTGKTTTARSLGKEIGLPLVEVKLSMITSQFLGETSKNIEKIFEISKRLNPCILFIDEFDYVAKTRTSDEHAAVKRAVNTLLKSIDEINLVEDGVILIAATNHPNLLDSAVWRRFDKIVDFPEPSDVMRKRIFELVLSRVPGNYEIEELAELTDGFTGSEINLVVREAVLRALLKNEHKVDHEDLINAIDDVKSRSNLKYSFAK